MTGSPPEPLNALEALHSTLYGGHEEELRELLSLPPDALTMALIPMGYPAKGRWAQPRRRPVGEVVH